MAKVLFGLRVKAEQKPISHSWVFVAWARKWVHKAKHLLPHYRVIQFLKTLISGEAKQKIKVIFKYTKWKVNVASVPQICQTIICWPPTDSLCELRQSKNLDKMISSNMKNRIACTCKHIWLTRLFVTIVVKQRCWNLQNQSWNLSLFKALFALNSQSNNISLRHRSNRVSN